MPSQTTDPTEQSLPAFYASLAATGLVGRLLELARDEDLGQKRRDLTALVCGSVTRVSKAKVMLGSEAVVSGLAVLPDLLRAFDSAIEFQALAHDGDRLPAGSCVATLRGPLDQIVTAERTILNLVGKLSGIASLTAQFVERAGGKVAVLDTRKTTPGLRVLEKYAVRCGGGHSHRLGLHDAVLIKDNHIAHLGPDQLTPWLLEVCAKARAERAAFIEVEVDTLTQLDRVLDVPAGLIDFVLLDNMDTATLRTAVEMRTNRGSSIRLEASGGVRLDTIAEIAGTGVERISVGAITHQAVTADVRLDIEPGA